MVETTIDVLKPSPLNLSEQEVEDIYALIDAGKLPQNYFELCAEAQTNNVFGANHKVDRNGNPIEQGRGSPGNQTKQSIDAYRKWGVNDVDYEKNLARMQKELDQSDARRAAERAAAPPPRRRAFQR